MRKILFFGGVLIAVIGSLIFWEFRPIPGVEAKGGDETIAWIGLASAIIGLLGAVFNFASVFVKTRRSGK